MVGGKNKLIVLRTGKVPHKLVTLGNGDNTVQVAVVILSTDELQEIEEIVEAYCQDNKTRVDKNIRARIFNKYLCMYAVRDPSDISVRMADNIDEIGQYLDVEDINRITAAYGDLMVNKAPKIELLNAAQLEEIKNYLEVTPLSDISTVSLVHLKSFHQAMTSEK